MIKLLAYRLVPLFLRPTAILLEGTIPGNPTVLALSLPIAMMALMLSSIPVHLNYYKTRSGEITRKALGHSYSAGLTWLTLTGLVAISAILSLPFLSFSISFIFIVCFTFLIEKLSDESSRYLEFRKKFLAWCLVQILRSGWVLFPIGMALIGGDYIIYYLVFSLASLFISFLIFFRITRLMPSFSPKGLTEIAKNAVFFLGSFMQASYRQLPRIIVAKLYPNQAHAFLALAQVAQGTVILFNVRFQIPYRKLIARRPKSIQRLLEPAMKKCLILPLLVIFIYGSWLVYLNLDGVRFFFQMLLFAPVVLADALLFSVFSAHLGYIQWFAKRKSALKFYILCSMLMLIFLGVLFLVDYERKINLSGVPVVAMVIGLVWLLVAKLYFFKKND